MLTERRIPRASFLNFLCHTPSLLSDDNHYFVQNHLTMVMIRYKCHSYSDSKTCERKFSETFSDFKHLPCTFCSGFLKKTDNAPF